MEGRIAKARSHDGLKSLGRSGADKIPDLPKSGMWPVREKSEC